MRLVTSKARHILATSASAQRRIHSSAIVSSDPNRPPDDRPVAAPATFEVTVRPGEPKEFDQRTHTGQAWDNTDYRLVRFSDSPKQVNPNYAINLIKQVPPLGAHSRVVSCDGGGGPLGHPKVYLNLDKPGNHACGYCGLRFYREGQENPGINHLNC